MENEVMIACDGDTYAERKIDLLHQLGYDNIAEDIFYGMNEIQIDNMARAIMKKPPVGYLM